MTINDFTSHVAHPSDLKLIAAGLSKFIYDFEVIILCQLLEAMSIVTICTMGLMTEAGAAATGLYRRLSPG